MSEQNLLNYNLFKANDNNLSYNFQFPISTPQPLPDQRRVAIATTSTHNTSRNYTAYDHSYVNQTSSPYYLPPITPLTTSQVNTNTITFTTSLIHQPQKQLLINHHATTTKATTTAATEQWDKSVSQSAIIIKDPITIAKALVSKNNNGNDHHHSIESSSDDLAPTHIVSPEAIREALKEEKEEELSHSKRGPFEQYSSFHALKQRRFSSDNSPPSLSIPFSPPPSIKLKLNYNDDDAEEEEIQEDEDDDDEYEEPESPFPTHLHNHTTRNNNKNHNSRYQDDATTAPAADTKKMTVFANQQEKLKRPPNAYLLFNRDMRRKLLKQSPKMTVAEISKEVGDWWKALPDDKREYYVKEASILKEEHLKKYPDFIYTRRSKAELAEAKKSSKLGRKAKSESSTAILNVNTNSDEEDDDIELYNNQKSVILLNDDKNVNTNSIQQTDHNPKKRSRKSSTAGGQRDPRGRKKKRHKHPFAPKHPMSAYLYYLASVYPQVSLNFPGSTVGPISKSISKTWHAMTAEERLPWKQKAESDKARYAREMQVYMAKNNEEEQSKLELQQQQQLQQQQLQQQQLQQQQLQQQQQQQQQEQQQQQSLLFNDHLQQLLSSDEDAASPKHYEEEDEEGEDVDVRTIAAVVHMVNNGGSLMYHSP